MAGNGWTDVGGGNEEQAVETGQFLFVFGSLGMPCVSHFLSTIKLNELFCFLS